MNELRELKLKKIMERLNLLVNKDMNGEPITDKEIQEFKALEEQLLLIGYRHEGNGLVSDLLEK